MSTNTIYLNLQCEFCGKILANKKSLKNHIARHIEAKESNFSCKFCSRISKNKMSHSQHERLCKENKNRPEIVSNFRFKKPKPPTLNACRFCNKEYHIN